MSNFPLASIPPQSDIYVDANIFIYSMLKQSPECDAFLQRCGNDIFAYSDCRVLHDSMHQLMLADAVSTSGIESMGRPKNLKKNTSLIPQLVAWKGLTQIILQLPIEWIPLTVSDVTLVPIETSIGLLCGDALHLGVMRSYGISKIATRDSDFGITGMDVYCPSDI